MKDLLIQYRKSREGITDMINKLQDTEIDEIDRTTLNGMHNELTWIIEWLETGTNPEEQREVNIAHAYNVTGLSNMDILPDIVNQLETEPPEITKEQKTLLMKILKSLSNRERDCFILHHGTLMSMQEIANDLCISKASVQMYIRRARDKINKII